MSTQYYVELVNDCYHIIEHGSARRKTAMNYSNTAQRLTIVIGRHVDRCQNAAGLHGRCKLQAGHSGPCRWQHAKRKEGK